MESQTRLEDELERQWFEGYLPEIGRLENPSVENPLDWYNRVGDKPVTESLKDDAEQAASQLASMPMHVLYRVFPACSQDIALVGHNPRDKLRELNSDSGELYELAQVEMNPKKIGEITGPRIARHYLDHVKEEKPLTDIILEALRDSGFINYDSVEDYLGGNRGDLPSVFEDIYITNLMKLPTRHGSGVNQFESEFYQELLWRELSVLSPEMVFVQGRPAWKSIRSAGASVQPLDGAPDTSSITKSHGHRYRVGDITVIPLVHPGAYQGNYNSRYDEARDILESSISEVGKR